MYFTTSQTSLVYSSNGFRPSKGKKRKEKCIFYEFFIQQYPKLTFVTLSEEDEWPELLSLEVLES